MTLHTALFLFLFSALSLAQTGSALRPDPPILCDSCPKWNAPREPFRLFGNTYYVGVAELTALLVTSDEGHILLDGGLPQSAPLIDANIRRLGFRTEDVRIITTSHEHFDHAGGIAALQRASGATVVASAPAARALASGEPLPEDPQYAFGRDFNGFPAVKNVRALADGEAIRVGPLTVRAHATPGHTPGGMTYSWRSCEGDRCVDVVFADSLTSVSAPGFRFTGDAAHPSRVETFRRTIRTVAELPCDILVSVHPAFSGLDRKIAASAKAGRDAFIDPQGCRTYAAGAAASLDKRIAEEQARP